MWIKYFPNKLNAFEGVEPCPKKFETVRRRFTIRRLDREAGLVLAARIANKNFENLLSDL